MIFPVRGLAAVPIPAEIGCNHRKLLGKLLRNPAPLDVRLRITVEKQKARSVPAGDKVDRGARSFRRELLEPRKKISVGRLLIRLLRDQCCAGQYTARRSNRAYAQSGCLLKEIAPGIVSHDFDPPRNVWGLGPVALTFR